MGQGAFAPAPIEIIHVQRRSGKTWSAAVAEMQGWRSRHEDAHFWQDGPFSYFGVLDGHGGRLAAQLVARRLPTELAKIEQPQDNTSYESQLAQRITNVFVETDSWLRQQINVGIQDSSGSTCVVAGVHEGTSGGKFRCFIANAGDSRGILIRRGQNGPDHWASTDHKPDLQTERSRIEKAGGFVSSASGGDVPRLDGNLAVSRGFGDFVFKQDVLKAASFQKVSCLPEVIFQDLRGGDIIVLACDGIFDVISSDALVKRIWQDRGKNLDDLAAQILRECLAAGSRDNMTLMLIRIGMDDSDNEMGSTFLGLDKYVCLSDESMKRMYRCFLKHCADGGDVPAEVDAILKEAVMDDCALMNVDAEIKVLVGMLDPCETPTTALNRCRPQQGRKRKSTEQQSPEELKFVRLTEVCDALMTHGVHDVYQCKREELDRYQEKATQSTGGSADAGSWWYRWTVGVQSGEIFGPFDTNTIASWMRTCCFSAERPAEFQKCIGGDAPRDGLWIAWDHEQFLDFLREHA